MANVFVQGYPTPSGSKILCIFDHSGPTSYSNIGSSSGTGDVVNASDLGLGGFDSVNGSFSAYDFTNTYNVKMLWAPASSPAAPASDGAVGSFVLQWFVISTGLEVANTTNLSAKTVRLHVIAI